MKRISIVLVDILVPYLCSTILSVFIFSDNMTKDEVKTIQYFMIIFFYLIILLPLSYFKHKTLGSFFFKITYININNRKYKRPIFYLFIYYYLIFNYVRDDLTMTLIFLILLIPLKRGLSFVDMISRAKFYEDKDLSSIHAKRSDL